MDKNEYWKQIYEKRDEVNSLLNSFWVEHSNMGTWQFWANVGMLLIPLVALYFLLERKRAFEILFYGFSMHMLWNYTDIILDKHGYFVHPYMLLPFLPFGLSMIASVLPVGFLLLYQYCTKKKKNFYLWAAVLSAVFAFGMASISNLLGLLEIRKGFNQFYLFGIDVTIAYIAYWLTKFVLRLQKHK